VMAVPSVSGSIVQRRLARGDAGRWLWFSLASRFRTRPVNDIYFSSAAGSLVVATGTPRHWIQPRPLSGKAVTPSTGPWVGSHPTPPPASEALLPPGLCRAWCELSLAAIPWRIMVANTRRKPVRHSYVSLM